ncbi:MAG: ATP synthase subunit C [Anaerolineae bacterium]
MLRGLMVVIPGLFPFLPALLWAIRRWRGHSSSARPMVLGISLAHLVIALCVAGLGLVWLLAPDVVYAMGLRQQGTGTDSMAYIAAAIAVGAGSLGAAYAVSTVGSAAVGAIAERPEIFGRALIFVGLAEGVAIYGLIIAFIILG